MFNGKRRKVKEREMEDAGIRRRVSGEVMVLKEVSGQAYWEERLKQGLKGSEKSSASHHHSPAKSAPSGFLRASIVSPAKTIQPYFPVQIFLSCQTGSCSGSSWLWPLHTCSSYPEYPFLSQEFNLIKMVFSIDFVWSIMLGSMDTKLNKTVFLGKTYV